MNAPTPPAPSAAPRGASLRLRINLIVAALMLVFTATLGGIKVQATRASVHEEIVASNRIATQLLERVSWIFARGGPEAMLGFLGSLGRVRANDIVLVDTAGRELYRSPPATYKAGRTAPDWFATLVSPPLQRQVIRLSGGVLTIEANPSRAILDGWDELLQLAGTALAALLLLNLAVFWGLGRALRPFQQIVAGLRRMGRGDFASRLPPLPGREAAVIGEAVNQLGEALEANVQQRIAAHEAERRLAESRDWGRLLEQRLEAERREIASELHDELGQSVTGIRSLARSLVARLPAEDQAGREAAALIDAEAARLYDAMHGLIPRLTPLALGPLGLPDALADLLAACRQRHPALDFHLQIDGPDQVVEPAPALAAYRSAQEAVNNAIKHSGGRRVEVRLVQQAGTLRLSVGDDGGGLPDAAHRPSRFGLLGLRARVEALGGRLDLGRSAAGGALVTVELPCRVATTAEAAP